MKTPLEAPPEQIKAETGVKETVKEAPAPVIDTSKMSKGQREALEKWRASTESGTGDPGLSGDQIANRLVFLMVNEAARCLEEKVVEAPEDADYGMILGTGFAPYRGGPLRFAGHFGTKKLVEVMDALHERAGEGDKFVPCDLLREHAQNGTKFYEDTARSAA